MLNVNRWYTRLEILVDGFVRKWRLHSEFNIVCLYLISFLYSYFFLLVCSTLFLDNGRGGIDPSKAVVLAPVATSLIRSGVDEDWETGMNVFIHVRNLITDTFFPSFFFSLHLFCFLSLP